MAPTKPGSALIYRQFVALGRPDTGTSKQASPKYRCKHCSPPWEGAASSPDRLKQHLNRCAAYLQSLEKTPLQPSVPLGPSLPNQKTLQQSGIGAIPKHEKEAIDLAAATAIITDGRPFTLFESDAFFAFFARLRPGWKPLSGDQVTQRLPEVHGLLLEEVIKQFRAAEHLNIIFDASDNVSGDRLVNVCVKLPEDGPAFYWRTFDTVDIPHTAKNWVALLMQELVRYLASSLFILRLGTYTYLTSLLLPKTISPVSTPFALIPKTPCGRSTIFYSSSLIFSTSTSACAIPTVNSF